MKATIQFPNAKENLLPDQIICESPPQQSLAETDKIDRIKGSLLGLAIGDALGASVEFRPRQYLEKHPVSSMQSGGTWGLDKGKWTDDTSMALCLATSLIKCNGFDPYNQLVLYKWWHKYGYLSSTGRCFDIGRATLNALEEFIRRQNQKRITWHVNEETMDSYSYKDMEPSGFDVNCGGSYAGGNGALMRLAPVPIFYYRDPPKAVELSGQSSRLTHGDKASVDACRYYGALIVAAILGENKEKLLSHHFYSEHKSWFGKNELNPEILAIAQGSFKREGGDMSGIQGTGHVVKSLQAALWAFDKDENSFEKGVLNAVNLGDDTDTTAAIYGQLAGAYYGANRIPSEWRSKLYAKGLISCLAEWLYVLGSNNTREEPSQDVHTNKTQQPGSSWD